MGKEYSGSKIRNCHYYPFDAVLPDTLTILFEERAQPKDTFKVVSQIKLVKAQ